MIRTRREAIGLMAAGMAAAVLRPGDADAAPAACDATTSVDAIDSACAPIISLLPDAAIRAGLPDAADGGPAARRCDDLSPDGNAALTLAIGAARTMIPQSDCDAASALIDMTLATHSIPYGRNDPLASIHRPYGITPFGGPHLDPAFTLAWIQAVETPAALDAWQARLGGYADMLLGAARSLKADEAAGCVPPATLSRAALLQMDAFVLAPAAEHPLVHALGERLAVAGIAPTRRDDAMRIAAGTLSRHVQPAMALLRDTMAELTRRGRSDPGVWTQPQGEALHAANVARAAGTSLSLAEAQAYARAEVKRITAQIDRRLTARGLKQGTIAERLSAAFAAHPGLIANDDADGRAMLMAAARSHFDAAQAIMPHLVSGLTVSPPTLRPIPTGSSPVGSFYLAASADGLRPAQLWLDTRSVYALPVPGVAPIVYHLGLPGSHLQANAIVARRPLIVTWAAWPAMTQGWDCYAERLAAEQGLFARDPWGDIARLSDELMRAARLVVDIGIHAQRWMRTEAEQAMKDMTGAVQGASIDRIMAMPGEAASYTLGLKQLLDLRERARKKAGKSFDLKAFHAAILAGGPRPFAMVTL